MAYRNFSYGGRGCLHAENMNNKSGPGHGLKTFPRLQPKLE